MQGAFAETRDNKITLLGDKSKNKKILFWNSFTEKYALDSFMKAILSSFESIMRLVTFYFLLVIEQKKLTIFDAIIGIYLLVILQKASRTLSEIYENYANFQTSWKAITEFLNLREIDFETVDIDNRNIHKNQDGVVQSVIWEEQSVKLGNDVHLEDSEYSVSELDADKISYGEVRDRAVPLTTQMIVDPQVEDNDNDFLDKNTSIIIGKAHE